MKRRIDLEKAAEAEVFGALAVGSKQKNHGTGAARRRFTPAQNRALNHMVRSLVQVAREAGAEQHRIVLGNVSFELREDGVEEILSIRTGAGS
jgi:hypothetical protein